MKTSVSLLLSCVFFASESAAEPSDRFGLLYLKEVPADGYTLTLDRVKLHEGKLSVGLFKFKWGGSEPVKIWGMGFDEDGTFIVLFENTSLFDGQQWTATNFGHCGTGSKLYEFQPGTEYTFRIAIWQFNGAKGEKGLVSIGGDTVSLISTPFSIATLENAIAN
jgi:hypothetical protein